MNDDIETRLFARKIRNYLIKRCVIIYIVVGAASILLGFLFFDLISPLFHQDLVSLILSFIVVAFVVGINLFLQWWSRFYPLPKELQDLIRRAGFKIGKRKFYHFRFFRRTLIYPTEDTYIKIGLEVKYFPFLELKRGFCKISMISRNLCFEDDPIPRKIVQDIAEKNLLSWKNKETGKKTRVISRKGNLRFKTSCNPEEAISRLMQMGKAIREWERAIERISELATST